MSIITLARLYLLNWAQNSWNSWFGRSRCNLTSWRSASLCNDADLYTRFLMLILLVNNIWININTFVPGL